MPAEKRIALLPFKYDFQGQYHEGDTIVVSETTYKQADLDARVSAALMKAIMSLSKATAGMGDGDGGQEAEANDEQFLRMMSMAYDDPDAFAQFFKGLRHALTNNADLCRVDGTDAPLSQRAWEQIAEANGIEAWYRICSVFLSFFLERLQSAPANGSARSTGSPLPPRAGSAGVKPPVYQGAN